MSHEATIRAALLAEADLSEKGLDFLDEQDADLIPEIRAEIEKLREAADCIASLASRLSTAEAALAAYQSALRSGEPETDQLRELAGKVLAAAGSERTGTARAGEE